MFEFSTEKDDITFAVNVPRAPNIKLNIALESMNANIGVNVPSGGGYYPEYKGSYTVTPAAEEQTLPTEDTLMKQDLVIEAIPYAEVTNNANGLTASIG